MHVKVAQTYFVWHSSCHYREAIMALYILQQAFEGGAASVPYLKPLFKVLPWLLLLWLIKWFFAGVMNKSERNMHSKVVLVTVGISSRFKSDWR